LDAICLPDAPYLADRLAGAKCAGVLSQREYLEEKDWEGANLCHMVGSMVVVVGLVNLDYRGTCYPSGAIAVEKLGEVIGPEQAAEFLAVDSKVYFHKLRMREYYGDAGKPEGMEATPELTPDGVAKALELDSLPTALLHTLFQRIEAKFTAGVTTANYPPDKMQAQGREIFETLQKRIPHLQLDSPLLVTPEPNPAPNTPPVEVEIVQKSAQADDADPDWMYVLSKVMEPNDGKDGAELAPDFDGEIYDRHLIRKIAYPYVRKYRQLGIMHDGQTLSEDEAYVAQSYVVDDGAELTFSDDGTGKERTFGPGTWFLGAMVKRDSDTGKKIESGELGAWSIDGIALKVPEKLEATA
jgi:hypothetical protein